jgi:MFS family permease
MNKPLPTAESVLATPPLDSHDAALRDFGRRRLMVKTAAVFGTYAACFAVLAFTPLLPVLFGIEIGWLYLGFISAVAAAAAAALVTKIVTPRIAAKVERDHGLEAGALGLDQYVIR